MPLITSTSATGETRQRPAVWPVCLLPALLSLLLAGIAPPFRWRVQLGRVTAASFVGEIGCRRGLHGSSSGGEREWDLCMGGWHWFVVVER